MLDHSSNLARMMGEFVENNLIRELSFRFPNVDFKNKQEAEEFTTKHTLQVVEVVGDDLVITQTYQLDGVSIAIFEWTTVVEENVVKNKLTWSSLSNPNDSIPSEKHIGA